MSSNRKLSAFASLWSILFLLASIFFFFRSELAFLFLGHHLIEMSFRRAVVIDSENADFFFKLGLFREKLASDIQNDVYRKQRYMDALSAIRRAVEINPYQLTYRISYSDLALKAGFPDLGERIFDFETLPGDFEFYLAHSFYFFKRAGMTQDESERKQLLSQGRELYQKARGITEFAESIATHKLKTLPSDIQSELTQTLALS